ncbi:Heavy metal-associated domain HMA [Arabidopsis suecica]|uniref:Heavy metal-associated domain HMA n=1 Tax=Arabidopsis suecica TaxID=45249 RepID=A0A8T1Z7T8_ARASU|nr:Heavy metal-associated domain HMA [Arabidopsis suecica]
MKEKKITLVLLSNAANLVEASEFLYTTRPLFTHIYSVFLCFSARRSLYSTKVSVMANVVELKVNLHCDECIRKILKAIKKIEDIETYDVDTQLNKVTVTGNVTEEQVIRVLHKVRKAAVKWDQDNQTLFAN